MISLIPATVGGRHDVAMSQQVSQTVQESMTSWSRGPERRKKKKKALLVGETTSTSQECPSGLDKGQETTIATSTAGCTVSIKRINKGDESAGTKRTDDKSRQQKEIDVKKQGKVMVEQKGESTDDDEPEDEPSMVEFEDPVYELSQTYEMESEYENMTIEQEATEVQALTPAGQAEYRELTRLHQ